MSTNECHGSLGDGSELEVFVKRPCEVIFRMHRKGADASNVRCAQCPPHRVLEQEASDSFALPPHAHRHTRDQHDRRWMPRNPSVERAGQA